MKLIYKTVDTAFAEMDFSGKGKIREEDFFNTLVKYKLPYSKEVSCSLADLSGDTGVFHPVECVQRVVEFRDRDEAV